jgi:hypothetical protein
MLVAGGFCYRMLLDESRIARESQNSPAPARASDRLLSIGVEAVERCHAAPGPEGRVSTSRRMSAKKKSHDAMFFVNTARRLRHARRRRILLQDALGRIVHRS